MKSRIGITWANKRGLETSLRCTRIVPQLLHDTPLRPRIRLDFPKTAFIRPIFFRQTSLSILPIVVFFSDPFVALDRVDSNIGEFRFFFLSFWEWNPFENTCYWGKVIWVIQIFLIRIEMIFFQGMFTESFWEYFLLGKSYLGDTSSIFDWSWNDLW